MELDPRPPLQDPARADRRAGRRRGQERRPAAEHRAAGRRHHRRARARAADRHRRLAAGERPGDLRLAALGGAVGGADRRGRGVLRRRRGTPLHRPRRSLHGSGALRQRARLRDAAGLAGRRGGAHRGVRLRVRSPGPAHPLGRPARSSRRGGVAPGPGQPRRRAARDAAELGRCGDPGDAGTGGGQRPTAVRARAAEPRHDPSRPASDCIWTAAWSP